MKYTKLSGSAFLLSACIIAAAAKAAPDTTTASKQTNVASSPDVNLTPRRVVFSPSDRGVKEVTVFNRSSKPATYNIELIDQVMTPTGELLAVGSAPDEQKMRLKSATSWLRYSPRQVVLGPNEAQTVRVQARRPADLAPGEYRSFFSVTAVPPQDTGFDIETAASGDSRELQVRLTPVYGIMIPIIVRHGETQASGDIKDVKLVEQGGRKAIQFTLTRSGDRSLYGGVDVFSVDGKNARPVAGVKGIGVYSEIDGRRVTLPLTADSASLRAGSKVRIVYTDDDFKPGNVLAQTELTLP